VDAQNPSNAAPVPKASAFPTRGKAPMTVQFSSDNTVDARGHKLSFFWDFGDGETSTQANPSHTYRGELYDIIDYIYNIMI
jgi:PKD repeat protein